MDDLDSNVRGFVPRSRPAHPPTVESHNRAVIVFLTVCTKGRRPCLASPGAAQLICAAWAAAEFWHVGRFVILPDHLHLFCAPATFPSYPLNQWINFWRRAVAIQWPTPHGRPLWQKDYWDRQLRSGDSYSEKWQYVRGNPVRHGLVANAADWPYQGELHTLRWHD